MTFHVLTLFPDFFGGLAGCGVVGRAIRSGAVELRVHNLRDWTSDRHQTVDDRPFGGGEGMLMKPEPIFLAVESVLGARKPSQMVILLSPQGRLLDQSTALELSRRSELLLICGRYEGVDERVVEHLVDLELSIGDYVLSGGEPAAAVVIDAVARLLPGVVGNDQSIRNESFSGEEGGGMLDCPQYTRPAEFRGWPVPEVLLEGNHEAIRRWRRQAAIEKTARMRPDLPHSALGRKGGSVVRVDCDDRSPLPCKMHS